MAESEKIWFPAKRYGWGWSLPVTWQGWLVLAGFVVLLDVGVRVFPPQKQLFLFVVYFVVIVIALLAVVTAKGEAGGWRWGRKSS